MAEMTTKDEVVRYDGQQALTGDEKAQARANIGAGTSDFSGSYADLTGVPQSFPPSQHAATHGAGGADAVTVAQSQVEGLGEALAAKQDALSGAQLANIDAVPQKADEIGEWTFGGGAAHISGLTMLLNKMVERSPWQLLKDGTVVAVKPNGSDDDVYIAFDFYNPDVFSSEPTATRKRVLYTGDAPTAQEVEALIDAKIGNGSVVKHDAGGYYVEV